MVPLFIILGILLLLGILLCLPVKIKAVYTTELTVVVKYLFYKRQIIPGQEDKKKKKPAKQPAAKKEAPEDKTKRSLSVKSIIKRKGLKGFIDIVVEIAKFAANELKGLFQHMIISELSICVTVAGENAAEAAMNYGYCSTVLYPAVAVILENTNCKKHTLDLQPDFSENGTTVIDAGAKAKIKLFWVLKTALSVVFKGAAIFTKI